MKFFEELGPGGVKGSVADYFEICDGSAAGAGLGVNKAGDRVRDYQTPGRRKIGKRCGNTRLLGVNQRGR